MICGLPVLTTANCGFAHYISAAEAGEVLPHPYHQDTLTEALHRWLNGNQMGQWSKNGPSYAKRHNLSGLIEEAATIIEQANRRDSN